MQEQKHSFTKEGKRSQKLDAASALKQHGFRQKNGKQYTEISRFNSPDILLDISLSSKVWRDSYRSFASIEEFQQAIASPMCSNEDGSDP